jgi:hypothetical protein
LSLADDFDAIPVKGATRKIEYSEGPPTAAQAAYPRVEIAGTAAPGSLADEFDALPVTEAAAPAAFAVKDAKPVGRIDSILRAWRDPIDGGAQLLTHALPASVVDAGNKFNNWLADKTGLVAPIPVGGVDQMVQEGEQQYQAGRRAANGGQDPGFDGWRAVGSVASPANLALAELAPMTKATSLAQLMARGGVSGGSFGLLSPVVNGGGDYWNDKGKQVSEDAMSGALMAPVGAALARAISPKTTADVKLLMNEGVTPTPGQILGDGFARTEDKLTSVPILGDMIKNSQRRAVEDFNQAAYNRALGPIGESSEANIGRAGIEEVKTKLGDAYNALLPKLNFRADAQFSSELGNLSGMINNGNVPPQVAKQFDSILQNEVVSRMTKGGTMDGQNFKAMEDALTDKIKAFGSSSDPSHRDVSRALSQVLQSARDNLTRSNPQAAQELSAINQGYANYARLRQASAALGAEHGVFTPAQLQNAVKAGDKSVGKGGFATGNALMQDLSEAGKTVLGSKYPDSGTAGRAAMYAVPGMAGMAMANPLAAALAGGIGTAAVAPYTALGQKLAAALLARRPAGAESVANGVRSAAPLLGAALAPFAIPTN